jgi:hypothetical protein
MLQIELTADELIVLADLLKDALSELRMEIMNTDNMSYKEGLQFKEAAIRKIIHALPKETFA